MSIRKKVNKDILDELETVISKHYRSIVMNSKLVGVKTEPEWEKLVSRQYFDEHVKTDIQVSQQNNMIKFDVSFSQKLIGLIEKMYPGKEVTVSGHFHYPKTGYMMWHTNSNFPCTRLYVTYADESQNSFFRYIDPKTNETVTDYDDKGITVREFKISDKPPYLWHAVGSNCNRLSFGFRIK